MGTPEFAVPSLEILISNGYNVEGVITAPDKPKGRGRKLSVSPVKECALQHNIPVLQPTNLKDADFQEELRSLDANLQVVVAFRMLPEAVWSMPSIGTFNLHASLLPDYRGAAPINWAIINGEKETGLTTFFLKHEIDTGDMILQETEPIMDDDTAGILHDRMKETGAKLVLKTVELIANDDIRLEKQVPAGHEKNAPKIFREDCSIDWANEPAQNHNLIRGLSPYPGAWTIINGTEYKILRSKMIDGIENPPGQGEFSTDGKSYIYVGSGNGVLEILELQKQGKRKMVTEEFLRGNQL